MAGHMMYVRDNDLVKFRSDSIAFLDQALAATAPELVPEKP